MTASSKPSKDLSISIKAKMTWDINMTSYSELSSMSSVQTWKWKIDKETAVNSGPLPLGNVWDGSNGPISKELQRKCLSTAFCTLFVQVGRTVPLEKGNCRIISQVLVWDILTWRGLPNWMSNLFHIPPTIHRLTLQIELYLEHHDSILGWKQLQSHFGGFWP